MQYPAPLIDAYGNAIRFAEAASKHADAPKDTRGNRRRLGAAAVYMWKRRDTVPHMWRPVVSELLSSVAPSEAPDGLACSDAHGDTSPPVQGERT
jgi:hypothetical protein